MEINFISLLFEEVFFKSPLKNHLVTKVRVSEKSEAFFVFTSLILFVGIDCKLSYQYIGAIGF